MKVILELDGYGDVASIRDELAAAKQLIDYIHSYGDKVTVQVRVPEETIARSDQAALPYLPNTGVVLGGGTYDPSKYLIKNEYHG